MRNSVTFFLGDGESLGSKICGRKIGVEWQVIVGALGRPRVAGNERCSERYRVGFLELSIQAIAPFPSVDANLVAFYLLCAADSGYSKDYL